jgi:hypothetical protein
LTNLEEALAVEVSAQCDQGFLVLLEGTALLRSSNKHRWLISVPIASAPSQIDRPLDRTSAW